MLPQLRKLEHKYEQELVIIGVHAGKFTAERVTGNIRQAVARLGIEHPVINDRHFRMWRSYGVQAWPTIVLINPLGHFIDSQAGEFTFEGLDPVIASMVRTYEEGGRLARGPRAFQPETVRRSDRELAFPAKVLATADGRLFVADTDHNRLLALRLGDQGTTAMVEAVIGSGQEGLTDGPFDSAAFNHPHGMALLGDTLYIADTENHVVRAADLAAERVTTIAGTGEQARLVGLGGPARSVPLNSPWDLLARADTLYIAMAGSHQIYTLDLNTERTGPFAGNGREDLVDGPARVAELAQPSGIAGDERDLYVADTESSAVRQASLFPGREVRTVVGKGLFDFGDKDGIGDGVRLQHPQGITAARGKIYVADTYNNKIKLVDPRLRRVATVFGTGEEGCRDGSQASFDEPGGLSGAGDLLYVADTNNHAVRVADLRTGEVTTLAINW